MEFLDDLLNQSESPEEEEGQQTKKMPDRRASSPGEPPSQTPPPSGGTGEEAWADLLEGVDFSDTDENGVERDTRARRRREGALTTIQKLTLGILGLVVVGLWGVIIVLVVRSFAGQGPSSAASGDAQVTVVSYTNTTPGAADEGAPRPTATPDLEEGVVASSPTPTPRVTPSPTPPIATTYDIQIQENPDDIELYLQRGRQYTQLGAYQAALADFSRAQELDDERAEAYVGEGWASFYSGFWQRAEEAFGTAIAFDQDIGEAHFGLGQVTYYQGRYEEAAREFDWAAEIDPANAEAEAWLAIASARMDLEDEAFGAVSRAISQTEELAVVYVAQSWARRIDDPPDIDGAQADLLYARELEPNSFLTLNALAQFYVDHRPERLAEAELLAAYAEDWATNDVQRAVALQTLGQVYLAQDRKVDAERVLIRAIDLVSREGEILLTGLEEDLSRARQ
ncbi:MAG: hypothetical protein JXC32_02510 [Anaerolineae bacterium]|nr:hypothetical protein [Anaerolineae bacterium]